MQQGMVIGQARATVKHPSLTGWRLLLVQILGNNREPDGDVVLAVDNLGCRPGVRVVVNSDGKRVRELVGKHDSPARWFVCGIVDEMAT